MRVLREMAIDSQTIPGLNYEAFRRRLRKERFAKGQQQPLNMRLDLLDSFMRQPLRGNNKPLLYKRGEVFVAQTDSLDKLTGNSRTERDPLYDAWEFKAGSLTIVDLSCPFVDESSACALFGICLEVFLETRNDVSRIVALDEAHKASSFSLILLCSCREGKFHLANIDVGTVHDIQHCRYLIHEQDTADHQAATPSGNTCRHIHARTHNLASAVGSLLDHDSPSIHLSGMVSYLARASGKLWRKLGV